MPKGKGTKRMSKRVSKKMVGGQVVPMGMVGMGMNQKGEWIWDRGGLSKAWQDIKQVASDIFKDVKPSEVAGFLGKGIPVLGTVGNVLSQVGLGAKPKRRRAQRGRGADSYHTSASMLPTTSPNTSNFGSVRF